MKMKRIQMSSRQTIVTLAAALCVFGALAGGALPAEAQTTAYPDASNTGVPAGTALTADSGNKSLMTGLKIILAKLHSSQPRRDQEP